MDEEYFTTVYKMYFTKIYRYVLPFVNTSHADAIEAAQEIFVRMWIKQKDVKSIRDIESYLLKSARNYLIDRRRRIETRIKYEQNHFSIDTEYNNLEYKEKIQAVTKLIANLADRRQQIYKLHISGYSLDEICVNCNLSKSVVKKELSIINSIIKKSIL